MTRPAPNSLAPETRGSWWTTLTDWRDWRLPAKLGAVLLVPVILAVAVGSAQIQRQVGQADHYRAVANQVRVRDEVQPLLIGLQEERTRAAEYLAGSSRDPGPLKQQAQLVGVAIAKGSSQLQQVESAGPLAVQQVNNLRQQLAKLPQLHQAVFAKQIDPVTAVNMYSEGIHALMSVERAVVTSNGDSQLMATGGALEEMSNAEDEIRAQQALVGAGLNGRFTKDILTGIDISRARLADRLREFRATSTPEQQSWYDQAMSSPPAQHRDQLLAEITQLSPNSQARGISSQEWQNTSDSVNDLTAGVRSKLSNQLSASADQLENEAGNAAGLDTVLLTSALLVAATVSIIIARQLLRSLEGLRRGALDTAQQHLPQVVDSIRETGRSNYDVQSLSVGTHDEIGQVAEAFDEVNRQAVTLASEQAALRRGYSESFVNVSRRSQSLLERQLRLFEQLEQDEEDPDQLSTLFQLDHLATRMRRNNENQMLLSGSDLARRFNQPTELADVLRAGVSEIEQYPRVTVQPAPSVRLVGYAASDLVRLTAEVLDNAANFSSPETTVTVSSHQVPDGSVTVDIVDRGIGMSPAELTEANRRLAGTEEIDPATSRRMGLFVAGRLAVRHGLGIQLSPGQQGEGVRATMILPATLVLPDDRPQQHQPTPAHGPGRNGFAHKETSQSEPTVKRHVLEGQGELPTEQQSPPPRHGMDTPAAHQQTPPPPSVRSSPPEPAPPPIDPQQAIPDSPSGLFEPQQGGAAQPSAPPPDIPEPPPRHREPEPDPQDRGLFEAHNADGASPTAELFMPLSRAGGQPQQREAEPEWPDEDDDQGQSGDDGVTPIFNEMATQWFRPASSGRHQAAPEQEAGRAPAPAPESAPAQQDDGAGAWSFATDDAQQRVDQVASAEPGGYTTAGLPRRTPRAQLAPGSAPTAGSEPASNLPQPERRPEDVSSRLSSFKSGARRGHDSARHSEEPADSAPAEQPAGRDRTSTDTGFRPMSSSNGELPGTNGELAGSNGAHGANGMNGANGAHGANGDFQGASSGWTRLPSDDVQQSVNAAASSEPRSYTTAGLPQRTPRARLTPGSAPAAQESDSTARSQPERRPEEVSERLSSFKQGARRGHRNASSDD